MHRIASLYACLMLFLLAGQTVFAQAPPGYTYGANEGQSLPPCPQKATLPTARTTNSHTFSTRQGRSLSATPFWQRSGSRCAQIGLLQNRRHRGRARCVEGVHAENQKSPHRGYDFNACPTQCRGRYHSV